MSICVQQPLRLQAAADADEAVRRARPWRRKIPRKGQSGVVTRRSSIDWYVEVSLQMGIPSHESRRYRDRQPPESGTTIWIAQVLDSPPVWT